MDKAAKLIKRLEQHPELLESVESILDVVDNKYGNMEKADDVEERVIKEMHCLGRKTLEGWGKVQAERKAQKFALSGKGRKDSKKN